MIEEITKRRRWLARLGERWLIPHSSVPRTSRDELRRRIRSARPLLVQRIRQAISDDANLIENSEYQAALAEQERNEIRIADLEDKLARAEIVDVSKLSGDTIKFGATVMLTSLRPPPVRTRAV